MSKIEWTEQTWNPIVGCSIVSPGCTNCYAMGMAARLEAMADGDARAGRQGRAPAYSGTTKWVKGKPVWTGKIALSETALLKPLRRKKPTMYFVNSMGDLFHRDAPDEWIDRVFAVMAATPQHTYQVLTKRSARMLDYLSRSDIGIRWAIQWRGSRSEPTPQEAFSWARNGLPNVWLGVSAERQQEADERIPDLLATPAAVRFVSAEPLLGPVDLRRVDVPKYGYLDALTAGYFTDGRPPRPGLDWVIVGGESGPGARPMHPDWVRSIWAQCGDAGVPFFFKQWGAWADGSGFSTEPTVVFNDGSTCAWSKEAADAEDKARGWNDRRPCLMSRVGKASAGHELDGRVYREWPRVMEDVE